MTKRTATPKKTVTEANLLFLGEARLAALLTEAASIDPALKRRLRMELAAEVGAADLAFEIDKRLTALATSRARVSWRKRPALLNELRGLLRVITDRMAPLDLRLALDRLVGWFDLYPALDARVSDAKGELPLLFDQGTEALAALASDAGPDVAAPVLAEALSTRLDPWASWVGRSAPRLDPELAKRLLGEITRGRATPTGRLALVVRKLADRSGDLDGWLATIPADDRRKPETGSEIARRLALAGRPAEARVALEASETPPPKASRWGASTREAEPPSDMRLAALIAVLDAEGRVAEADAERWRLFDRTLDPDALRGMLANLPDFEDVVALDKAFVLAASHADLMKGLAFLMNWPALREAADMIVSRADGLRGAHEDIPLWMARLSGRFPLAALRLGQARIRALSQFGGAKDEIVDLLAETEALALTLGGDAAQDHASFVAGLPSRTRTFSARGS